MSLDDLLRERRLQRHRPSRQEIADLLKVAERALEDARLEGLSPDGRFVNAYHGMLALATAVLAASGLRAVGGARHATTIETLALVMKEAEQVAAYLEICRRKRNQAVYERAGVVTESEARELTEALEEFIDQVRQWLKQQHPSLAAD